MPIEISSWGGMLTVISNEEFFVPFQGRNPVLFFELQRSLNEYLPWSRNKHFWANASVQLVHV